MSLWSITTSLTVRVCYRMIAERSGPSGNPAIPFTFDDAKRELERMRASPLPLARPVVILNGYHTWAGVAHAFAAALAPITSGRVSDFVPVSYGLATSIERAESIARSCIERTIGNNPFDAVGISMGGIVGRSFAAVDAPRRRMQTLFTFGSPHTGSSLSTIAAPDRAAKSMLPGCPFLAALDSAAGRPARIRPYAQLKDGIVGARFSAPTGSHPLWTAGTDKLSHFTTPANPIFLADIARILRGEEPLLDDAAACAPPIE